MDDCPSDGRPRTGMKYCGTSDATVGRPVVCADALTADAAGALAGLSAATGLAATFERVGSVSVLIWFLVSGPARYDKVHRVSNTTGASSWTLFIKKILLPRPARVCS